MSANASSVIETPSGKAAANENFPVGSILLPRRLRPHVAVFYAFARAADDIADNPSLAAEDKVARLDAFDRALLGEIFPGTEKAARMRESLLETGVVVTHCRDLLRAFKQDAVKLRYADWDDLMGYCCLSASPVGRYLLDLHEEDPADYPPSDALCNALQVLNHLQDCAADLRDLNRVYLPQDWLGQSGVGIDALRQGRALPGLRRVLDLCLDATDRLLITAEALPLRLSSRRLAMESAAILDIARKLSRRLRARDPLAERVELTRPAFLASCVTGAWQALTRPGRFAPRDLA